jgi:hypothetical protein
VPRTDTCAFCGKTGTDFKPEHWVPKWVSRATVGKNQRILHNVPGRDPWFGTGVNLTVEHVCPDCNHGWMSDVETGARDVVLPFIEGKPTTLDTNGQRKLATWSFMKLISLELGRSEDQLATYPAPVYQGFAIFRQPPNGCLLSVGFREMPEEPPLFVWWRSQAGEQAVPGVGPVPSYRTALCIGHLVIDVIGVVHPGAQLVTEQDDRLIPVWPVESKTLDWPPAVRFKGIIDNDLA